MRNLVFSLGLLTWLSATPSAHAALAKTDFLLPSDGLLVNDSMTNLQWLTPVYTSNLNYNHAIVLALINDFGFRYATAGEVISLIILNFGNPITTAPGNAAGYASAGAFFDLFGIAEDPFCPGFGPCPRTQGLTATSNAQDTHRAFGMIQRGSDGWFIMNNNWADNQAMPQLGSFLVRNTPVPEPGTLVGVGLGLALVALRRRYR